MEKIVNTQFLIVGTGANGISPAALLKKRGIDDFRIITKHSDFGGVWHENHYPGCMTDVPVLVYQLSVLMSYDWTASHATRPEMASYLRRVAREFDLYSHTDFNTELHEAHWLEDQACWHVFTSQATYHARFLVLATGYLEQRKYPNLAGKELFEGRLLHSADWPEGYTGEGERIAVLGSSSSAVQIVPELQKIAKQVYVFQRTPVHLLPLNRVVYTTEELAKRRSNPAALNDERLEIIRKFDASSRDSILGTGTPQQRADREAWIDRHRESQVADPVLREQLRPKFKMGCKRATQTDLYYPSLQQPNVELVPEGATALGKHSIFTASGREFEIDTVVMATGFYYGGDILNRIRRRDGQTVAAYQRGHRRAYKSVSVSQCPNLFLIGGAGANGAVWHGYAPGEIVSNYLFQMLDYMKEHGLAALEIREEAEWAWKRMADEVLSRAPTVTGGCSNYALDETGHDMSTWPGTKQSMEESLGQFVAQDYESVVPGRGETTSRMLSNR